MSVYRIGSNKSSVNNFPSVRPTLDLDFANSKTLDPRIDFARASGGSYVGPDGLIKYAGVNEPRFDHDPVTGESLGLLVEVGTNNLFLRSEEFESGYWELGNSSILSNIIESPDGSLTADKLVENTENTSHIIFKSISLTLNAVYNLSVFLKYAGRQYVRIQSFNALGDAQTATFDLIEGVIIDFADSIGQTNVNPNIIKYQNGWYRCSLNISNRTDTSSTISLAQMRKDANSSIYQGDGTSGIYIWGAQLEASSQGAFPTSYIPTQGSARTRGADQPRITGKNFTDFYNQPEGTIKAEYSYNTSGTQNHCPFSFDNGTNLQTIVEANFAPNGDRILSSGGANTGVYYYNVGENIKRTVGYKLNDFATSVQGSSLFTVTTFIPPTPTQLCIGHAGYFYSSRINGHIRSLKYYPKRLPNEQLIALTR